MLIEAGVDWLTATTADAEVADRVGGQLWQWLGGIRGGQEIPKVARLRGYQGRQVPGIFFGQRNDGWMVVLSSGMARTYAKEVLKAGMRASRIDTQVTCWVHGDPGSYVLQAFEDALSWTENKGRPPALKLIRGRDGYETTLIGSRSSEEYARVYDKFLESELEGYRNAVRWEVENKGETAHILGQLYAKQPDFQAYDRARVRHWFQRRGISVPFAGNVTVEEVQPPKRESSLDKAHQWLRHAVAPTIAKLLAVEGAGPALFDVLSAGIDSASVTAIIEAAAERE